MGQGTRILAALALAATLLVPHVAAACQSDVAEELSMPPDFVVKRIELVMLDAASRP